MALRLTGTPLQSPQPVAPAADLLTLQARTALDRGDLAAYRAMFADVAALTDSSARYGAQLALLQTGFAVSAGATDGLAMGLFVAIADAALTMLERDPAEPVILNLAGVSCYELWSLDAAEALFRAARRLDPELAEAERNLQAVGRRRRATGRRTRPLHAAVPGLARRARSVAQQAKPATGLTLSLCMIVRDEEQMLPRCLAAVAPAVDEIVVVDTGSTDATVEIARSFGARVIEHPWTGSFAEARNVSFDAATGDWVMYLDADEILVEEDVTQLRGLRGQTWREAFFIVETSFLGELGSGAAMVTVAPRIFRNRPSYRFEGRLHEQIFRTLPAHLPGRVGQTSVRVDHYGYLGSIREAKEKSRRNIELLKVQAETAPPTAFLHFNLGSEYYAAGDAEAGVTELMRSREMLEEDGSLAGCTYSPLLFARLVMALRVCDRLDEAASVVADGLELLPDFTDLVLERAIIARALGHEEEAEALFRRCLELGDAPPQYGSMRGCGTFLPHMHLADLHLGRGETGAARARLARCAAENPDFMAVAVPYAQVMLRDGASAAAVMAELEGLGELPARVRQAVATSLQNAGELTTAEAQFRLVLDAAPTNALVRTTLGQLLLARGAWDDAADTVRPIPDDDAHAALASRIELMALTGRAGDEPVQAALARAERSGLPRAEQTVFRAWAAMTQGGDAPQGLPVAGVPVLAVALETLLAAGDAARFNALLPALAASRLERREQRELLGEMFLSHGLLAQAAQEWMTVCAEQPDVRALIGLARVAERNGMPADAATFATGALELDPRSAAATALLDRLPAMAPAGIGAPEGAVDG